MSRDGCLSTEIKAFPVAPRPLAVRPVSGFRVLRHKHDSSLTHLPLLPHTQAMFTPRPALASRNDCRPRSRRTPVALRWWSLLRMQVIATVHPPPRA